MGLICDVNENQVVIKRISFNENKYYGDDWIIDVPINKNNFRYLYKEMDKNSIKPYFILFLKKKRIKRLLQKKIIIKLLLNLNKLFIQILFILIKLYSKIKIIKNTPSYIFLIFI